MTKILPLLFILQSCIGAGDMFAEKRQIVGDYYLIEGDDGHYDLSKKIHSDYVGRNPLNSKIIAYGLKDSILIIKSQDYESRIEYYVLNMNKDSGYRKNEEIYIDTISDVSFERSWIGKSNIDFKAVK